MEIYETILTHERIRKKIEEQIHGAISTKLLLVQHDLILLRQSLSGKDSKEEARALRKIESAVLDVMENNLRSVCHQLYPSIIKLGLSAGLRFLKSQYEKTVPVSVRIDKKFARMEQESARMLPEEHRLFAYRIAEESLANSVLHSGATALEVELLLKISRLHLYIRDNGKGFIPEEKKDGPGLMSMRSYARAMGAILDIKSALGTGAITHLSLALS